MPLSNSLTKHLALYLGSSKGHPVDLHDVLPVSGGSINDAYCLGTSIGKFFLKVNTADRFPSLFEAEADGLERSRKTGAVRVPEVIGYGEEGDETFLLMEHIAEGERNTAFWERFGRSLARLHGHSQDRYGLDRDNYIGTLKQVNTPDPNWASFFIHHRLEPQLKLARDKKRVDGGTALRFERLFGKLEALFPKEAPALLHGDLWSGNFLCDADGRPVLIDPAVYYGHREMDVAMTKLFGGFDAAFYTAYMDERPLEQGWKERVDLCNLYPLLVHVNLFGGSYLAQVEGVLKRFV